MWQKNWMILLVLIKVATSYDGHKIPENDDWKSTYHIRPKQGWMNDPNGLIWFDGYYHAFYQHNPHSANFIGNQMSWGHARSKDMLAWEYLPTALSPSLPADAMGCWSGSAVNDDGVLRLIYTGCYSVNSSLVQAQCLASSSNTIDFVKYGNVLEPPSGTPHFRDPKVWKEDNGFWYMVVSSGNDQRYDVGSILLYKSANLYQWSSEGVLVQTTDRRFECPDLFKLGDKHVVLISTGALMNETSNGWFQTEYSVGHWTPESAFVSDEDFKIIDRGHDFYAAQTFQAPDGRRIMIGWLGLPDATVPEKKYGWAGMLTIPRELSLSNDNTVAVVPIREAKALRQNPPLACNEQPVILLDQHSRISDHRIEAAEFTATWRFDESSAEEFGLRLGADANSAEEGFCLHVDTKLQHLVLDRRYPQVGVNGSRSIPLPQNQTFLFLQVYFDKSSVEVFINNNTCMSSRIYPTENSRFLYVYAKNGSAKLEKSSLWNLNNGKSNASSL